MDEIPDDIEEAAAGVVASLGIGGSSNPNPDGFTIRDAIARALLAEREAATKAEREACHGVAIAHSQVLRQNFDRSSAIAVEGVATAIRSGARP